MTSICKYSLNEIIDIKPHTKDAKNDIADIAISELLKLFFFSKNGTHLFNK